MIAPVPAELIANARAMIPALAARALEQRRMRRILPETIAQMQAAGFFRVLQPRRWGGYEMDLGTFYAIEIALGEGDMSTGWTYGVLGVVSWVLGLFDDRAAQEAWGTDASVLICSSTMPAGKATAVDGGFRLSGHWRYASGCEHCGWALLGGMVGAENAAPDWRFFLVPRRDYRTVDAWQVAGLQGTGSIDVILDDVFVPAYRTQRLQDNFLLRGAGQALNTSRSLPAALRPDFRARRVNRRTRRLAGNAGGAHRSWPQPRDARGRAFGGKSVRAVALRRDGGGDR